MNTWVSIAYIVMALCLLGGIAITIWSIKSNRQVLKTIKLANYSGLHLLKAKTVGMYYLPESILCVKGILTVNLDFNKEGTILSATVIKQEFRFKTLVQADTSSICVLAYQSNYFSHDEFQFAVNDEGLLENVAVVAEDRTSHIVSSLLSAPFERLDSVGFKLNRGVDDKRFSHREVKIVERDFELPAWETIEKESEVSWTIDFPEYTRIDKSHVRINAEFKIRSNVAGDPSNQATYKEPKEYHCGGLLFRAKCPIAVQVSATAIKDEQTFHGLSIFNRKAEYCIPIENAPFVKKEHILQIKGGELMSHRLVNPSVVNGFINIPVVMVKAIISIPAQIFSLKIDWVSRVRDYEAAKGSLQSEITKNKLQEAREKELAVSNEKQLLELKNKLVKSEALLAQVKVDSTLEINKLERQIRELENGSKRPKQ
jgi:hypothetical protein